VPYEPPAGYLGRAVELLGKLPDGYLEALKQELQDYQGPIIYNDPIWGLAIGADTTEYELHKKAHATPVSRKPRKKSA